MHNLTPFRCEYKNTARARKIFTGVRFYPDAETARQDWTRVIEYETCGRGVVVAVAPEYAVDIVSPPSLVIRG